MKGRDPSEDLGIDGLMISKWILGYRVGGSCTRSIWLMIGRGGQIF
jgi:hypothetical protein